jgi:hypothetical protein
VEVISITMVCPDRPKGNIVFDLKLKQDGSHKVENVYVLKEGSKNKIRIEFKVHNDIVYGLKYCSIVKKWNTVVDKEEENIGSYAPQKQS